MNVENTSLNDEGIRNRFYYLFIFLSIAIISFLYYITMKIVWVITRSTDIALWEFSITFTVFWVWITIMIMKKKNV